MFIILNYRSIRTFEWIATSFAHNSIFDADDETLLSSIQTHNSNSQIFRIRNFSEAIELSVLASPLLDALPMRQVTAFDLTTSLAIEQRQSL